VKDIFGLTDFSLNNQPAEKRENRSLFENIHESILQKDSKSGKFEHLSILEDESLNDS
jgi:hypothetical protein